MDTVSSQGVDVGGILSRRKWLVILGFMLGLGLGYVYMLQATPRYESVAQILIEDKQPPTIPLTGVESQYITTSAEAKHAIVIVSPRILTQAFDNFNLFRLPTFKDDPDPLLKLSENLKVELVEDGTNVLNIRFIGPYPEDTQKVVNAVLHTYQQFLQEAYEDSGTETRDLIVKAKDDLLKKWQMLEREYGEFKASTPLMYNGQESINVHAQRQADYENERVSLQKQMTELGAQIKSVEEALERDDNLESILLLAEKDGHQGLKEKFSSRLALMQDRYMALVLQQEELEGRYGKDHPDVLTVRRQLERYETTYPELVNGTIKPSRQELFDYVTRYLASLKQKQIQLKGQYESLTGLFNQEEDAAKELQILQAKDEQFQNEIARTQQLFEVVVKSLEEISLVSDYEGYNYQTLAKPTVGDKVAPLLLKVMPIAALFGVVVGFGIAYLVDVADKAFRTPDEVASLMRLPVIGHVPLIDPEKIPKLPGCNIEPIMCTVHKPKSPQAESYRAVRTALYFNSRGERHQVIQVTSPMPGDGKSTLASNLAVTIAQSGKSVLLLDADFRRPTQHEVFAMEAPEIGLASVVAGDAEPADAWQEIPFVPNLRIMACGPRPENPSELLSSESFANVLQLLRDQFDFVIVDTPPVLAVSDPMAVAARVDGVILTFRIHKRARPLALRARDALVTTGANVIGVVVNGVDHETSSYYSEYKYGYAGYRYGYNSRYGEYSSDAQEQKAISKYYDDESSQTLQHESPYQS